MSCARNSGLVSQAGQTTGGLSGLSNKLGYTIGQLTPTMDRMGQAAAPVTGLAIQLLAPRGKRAVRKRAALARLTSTAVAVGARVAGVAPLLGKVRLAIKVSESLTGQVGNVVSTLSETGTAGQVVSEKRRLFFFKAQETTDLSRSALTAWLNQHNVIGQRKITANNGVIFTQGGKSWHRGTVTFMVGENKRTITQLQSLNYPAESYYFTRRLNNRQAVSLAAGQTQAETMPGFVGRVGAAESLSPTWATAKRALILTHMHWRN